MQPLRIQFAAVDAPETAFDRAIEWLLIGLLAFCPMAFGAVVAWSEGVFLVLVCAIAICFAIKLIRRPDARFVWSWAYLPIALFLILVAMQLLPLPAGVMRAISPNTAALKTRLLADLIPDAATGSMTLTFYPESTLRQLRMVAALAVIFVVVVNVFQTVESIRRLLIAISLIGLAEASLAIAQDLTHSTSIYWTIPVYDLRALSGSFVNHSHFGQFINLSIGAALALMLLEWHRRSKRDDTDMPEGIFAQAALWIAIAAIIACAIALLWSLTRGGVISMICACVLTLPILTLKAPSRSKVVAGVWLVTAVVVLTIAWVGFEQVVHRMTSITEANAANSRGQMLLDLREAWKQFPILGTGLGTHGVIFPMFDRSQLSAVATHAENEYAQTMTETGGVGLAMAIAFAGMIWVCYARAIRGHFGSIGAMTIGLGFGFAAILVHSLSDFGQHIPADAALTAVTCGLIVSLARQRRDRARNRAPEEFRGNVKFRIAMAVILAAAGGLALFAAATTALAEREFKMARRIEDNLRRNNWNAAPTAFADMIIHAQNAVDLRPGNVEYAYWLPVYRWKWISVQSDPARDPHYFEYARRIADELNHARLICPTYGLPASIAGQIEMFVLHDPRGERDIRLGSELNRNDPTAVFVDGQLAAAKGDWDRSLARLEHYSQIVPGGRVELVDLYVNEFHRPDLALLAAQGDAPALERLVQLLQSSNGDPQIIATAAQQAGDLRLSDANRTDADLIELVIGARIAIQRNDHDAAIGYLRRALTIDYTQTAVRYDLAKELLATGRRADAVTELHTVLRQRADFSEARQLLNNIDQ